MRVSDYIANHLKQIGAGPAFLLSGGGMMHMIDALGRAKIPYICTHHEQAAAMAAEGMARATGKLGLCYATSGPGATNVLTGLVGAWQDSSPVLFLTGQSKRSQTIRAAPVSGLRQFGTFEVDIVPIVQSVTKFAHFLDDPQQVRWILEKAVHLAATGRPGPVLIDIPLDVQGSTIDPATLPPYGPANPVFPTLDPTVTREVLHRVTAAQRPVLLVGHGVRVARGVDQLRELAHRLQIPVVTTQLAKDAFPYEDRLFAGHCGPKGDRAGNFAVQASDLVLSLGSSLHAQTIGYDASLFAPNAFKIQVDIDVPILGRGDVGADIQINSDILGFLDALLTLPVPRLGNGAWVEQCSDWKRRYAVSAEPHDRSSPGINYYDVADVLSDLLTGDEIIVTDAGSAFYVMGQAYRVKPDQRYIVSGALGSMGYALPAAVGAACSSSRSVVCITGDGSLQTNVHELQVIKHNNLNVKLVVVANEGYVSIRNTQNAFFAGHLVGSSCGSGVSFPPLNRIAHAYDIPYVEISKREEMVSLMAAALGQEGPMFIGVRGQSDQTIMPVVESRKDQNGVMVSNPLHIMYPQLSEAVLQREIGSFLKVADTAAAF